MAGRSSLAAVLAVLLALCAAPASAAPPSHEAARAAVRTRDFERAAGIWKQLAKQGDAEAAYRLGTLSRSGRGVSKSHADSFRWMKRAAEGGHAAAQYELSRYYQNGWGVASDEAEAARWLARAAAAGHPQARRARAARALAPERIAATTQDADDRLVEAVRLGDVRAVGHALGAGAHAEVRNRQGTPLLVAALQQGAAEVAVALLNAGADANVAGPDGSRPIHIVAQRDSASAIPALVRKGARLDARDAHGATALHRAARVGARSAARALVAAGAPVNARDRDGRTPLDVALRARDRGIARLLRRAGGRAGAAPSPGATREWARTVEQSLDRSTTQPGWSPLAAAAWSGEVALARHLIDGGADVDGADPSGQTPLDRAAGRGHREIVALLLRRGAKPTAGSLVRAVRAGCAACVSVFLPLLDPSGCGPALEAALASGSDGTALALLRAGVAPPEGSLVRAARRGLGNVVAYLAPGSRSRERVEAMCAAARVDAADAIDALAAHATPVRGHCSRDHTPAQEAARANAPDALRALLRLGADAGRRDSQGRSLLHLSAAAGCKRCLAVLGGALEARDREGRTPLMLAAASGRAVTLDYLLARGADADARDREGRKAIDFARAAGHADLVRKLE